LRISSSAEGRIEAIRRNADGYLVKPIQIDELLRTIKNHLEKQENATHDASEDSKG
jgi:DNA-binding response OmpR family regulator